MDGSKPGQQKTTKPMPLSLTRNQVRSIDAQAIADYGLPGIVLMENAGRGAAEILVELGAKGPVVICAGKGNNGGDGFVIARHLELRGVETTRPVVLRARRTVRRCSNQLSRARLRRKQRS